MRLVLFGMAAAGMLAVVVFGATAAIILSGATEIGLIRDRVQATLAGRFGPEFMVSVGKASMQVDPSLGLVVDLGGIEVVNRDGAAVLSVPAARLAIDAIALAGFRFSVTRAEIAAPRMAVVRDQQGRFRLEGAPPGTAPVGGGARSAPFPAEGPFARLAAAVTAVDRVLADALATKTADGLELTVTDGRVTVRDLGTDAVRIIDDIGVKARVDEETGNLRAEVSAGGGAGRWTATFKRQTDDGTGDRILSLGFSQVTFADLLPELAAPAAALSVDIPLYGSAEFVVGDDGVRAAKARVDMGAGVFRFGDSAEGILLDEATLRAHWDVAAGEVVVEPSSVHIGNSGGSFTGVIREEGDGRYIFAFGSRDTVLAARDSTEAPLRLDMIELRGSADLSSRLLNFDRIILQSRQGSFTGAGRLGFTGESPSLAVAAELTPMSIATWKQMWPPFLAPGARRWALDNILGGRIASARFEAAVPAGVLFRGAHPDMDSEAFRLDFRLEDVTVRTFGALPPISRASGHAVLAGSTFGIDLDSGIVIAPSGATVDVNAGAFAIDDVFDPGSDGVIEVDLSGDAGAVGEIANSEPFLVLDQRGLVPADLSGTSDVSVSVRVPLDIEAGSDPAAEVDWKVVVTGTDLASRNPIDGRTFSDGDVTIVVTPDGVTVNGTAEIDGVPAAVQLAQPLSKNGAEAPGGQQVASLALDREARLRLGLDIEDIVSGTVDAEVRSLAGREGEHYALDLRRSRLVIPGLGWSKGIGVPATMRFDVIPVKGGSRIENMELIGEGFGFVGSAELRDGEGLVSASVDKFRLRPGDDLSIELKAAPSGYAIKAEGPSFDVRGVIAELKGDVEDGGDTSNVSVEAKVKKMRGFNDRVINDAEVSFVAMDGVPRELVISGKMRGNAAVSVAYADDLDRATLQASSADAGAVYDFLDIYGRIGGGHLAVTAERPAPTGPLTGTLSMTGFAILDEPAMEEVISRARPRNGARIDTTRMHVEQMDAVFRYTGDEIFVDEAFLRGTAMGATFNGVFDLARSFMSMSGTYIPVYGINNAFSRVPVVGRILGGENAEGLIGVTFKVEGPIDGPRVFVNPLSAVAPGIFRKIFEFR